MLAQLGSSSAFRCGPARVGALGGVLAAGLASRLGPAAQEAGRLLAGTHGAGAPVVPPAFFRDAIERSLLPVFVALFVLAGVNLFLASGFPEISAGSAEAPKPSEGLA